MSYKICLNQFSLSANHLNTPLIHCSHNHLTKKNIPCSPFYYLSTLANLKHSTSHHKQVGGQKTMATMTTFSAATVSSPAFIGTGGKSSQKRITVKYISGLNSFGGLKANNHVASLGLPVCTEQSFAKIVSSLKTISLQAKGGALSATCNAALEIFRIASIIPGLVLVGVAVGFVLLRLEATVEESE